MLSFFLALVEPQVKHGINIGDIIFQLMTFVILLGIPLGIIVLFKRRNARLNRIEEKLDKLLMEKEKNE